MFALLRSERPIANPSDPFAIRTHVKRKMMASALFVPFSRANPLLLTRVNDGGLLAVLDGSAGGASGLNGLDDLHGLIVSDLAEDDVAAVQPGGGDGGDEELRAVAVN